MPLRVGIDLVKAATIEAALAEYGERYLRRVYTDAEVDGCRDPEGAVVPLRLAARFAAKEAAMKVLEPAAEQPVPWPEIEVVRTGAAPELRLHGRAADLAAQRGITGLALSFTHEDEYAAAVVLGT
jgi:holo-[acyl-carrier protein] synthase